MEEKIFEQMKNRRIQLGMTIRDLSKQTGLSEGYISHLEKGFRKNPSFNAISKICMALDMHISID